MNKWIGFIIGVAAAACGAPEEGVTAPTNAPAKAEIIEPIDRDALFALSSTPSGEMIATLPAADSEGVSMRLIHSSGITSGLGSNPVGMDRGRQDTGRIIAIRRVGDKVLIEEENWRYRASADNPLEKKAVLDSFARSILWAGKVKDEMADGSFTADISGFLTSDTMDLRGWLKGRGQGSFSIAKDRSFVDPSTALIFPDNVEIDAVVTLASDKPGPQVVATAAEGRATTLTIHHSFVRLPDPGYTPRLDDPRTGAIDIAFYDFSSPLDEPIVQRFARRFRLERVDPNAATGPVKKPIVFYVDSGAPEQIRDALIEGGRWWAQAFEEAGFEDAFRVELMPEDMHPFDIRYNVIQWTHRQTRGWSYGSGVHDPRTGEMLKGHVILGSQRVRQDRMIFEGLAGAAKSGTGEDGDPVEIALARIRQLSAHEIGHPLGFEHNFAASSIDRASVMDYPAPWVRPLSGGGLDLSDAYDVGIGDWDKFTVKWLYSQFAPGADEAAELEKIVQEGYESGLVFVSDRQGRSVGSGHPAGSVWDNGADPIAMLRETMEVRGIALDGFGLDAIQDGRSVDELNAVIVPIYLYHRYQVAAAAKLVGGVEFNFARKGDGREGATAVDSVRQRAALDVLIETLDPGVLDLDDGLLALLAPGDPAGGVAPPENFASKAGGHFDLITAADAAGSITLGALLHPARLTRLAENQRRNPSALTIEEMLSAIEAQLFEEAPAQQGDIARVLQARYVAILMERSMDGTTLSAPLRARIDARLKTLKARVTPGVLGGVGPDRAHRDWLAAQITQHFDRPMATIETPSPKVQTPPGSPIGAMETCWHCEAIN